MINQIIEKEINIVGMIAKRMRIMGYGYNTNIHGKILDFLKDAPRGLSTTQITQLLNESGVKISRVSVRKYLLELFGQGLVQRDKIGVARVWYLTPANEKGRPLISPQEWEIIDDIFNFLNLQDNLKSIQEIADALEVNRNTIANILRVMEQLGLVEERGQGRNSLWRVKAELENLSHVFSRIAVILIECTVCPTPASDTDSALNGEMKTPKNGDKTGSDEKQLPTELLMTKVLSMNSIAREMADFKDHVPNNLSLKEIEIRMFQRPLITPYLLSKLESIVKSQDLDIRMHLEVLPKSLELHEIFPRLERERNTFWKVSAQIEEKVSKENNEPPRYLITYQDVTAKFHMKHLIWRSARSFQDFFKKISVPVTLITPEFQVIEGNEAFQQLIGPTERFWGYHCFSLFRGKSRQCADCPILRKELPERRLAARQETQISIDGEEWIFHPGEQAPRRYNMRVIANISPREAKITSYFLVLQVSDEE